MTQEQPKPPPRRTTIVLGPTSEQALTRLIEISGGTQTDAINRAIRVYAYIMEVQAKGGDLIVRDAPEGAPERLRIM